MNKRTEHAPYWQAEPCPSWCGIIHGPEDPIAESTHQAVEAVEIVATTDAPMYLATLTGPVVPQVVQAHLAQKHLHRDPHVVLVLPGIDGQEERELRLTIGEVRELAVELFRLADTAQAVAR